MAVEQVEQSIVDEYFTREQAIDYARNALEQRGVPPDATGEYTEGVLLAAVAARGRTATVQGGPGDWAVEIVGEEGGEPFAYGAARDPDRLTALLRAVGWPMGWLTAAEAREIFDQEARRLLGMSGDEFLRRYDAGEFDPNDPDHTSVVDLSMIASFGRANPDTSG